MDSTQQRILEAAIAVIEEDGFHQVTVRRIAAKAGVNIAAISYYYRSKELLLQKVLDVMIDSAFDWSELQYSDELPPREQLFAVMEHLAKGAQCFPEVTRAYFHDALICGNYETRATREINGYMEKLCRKFRQKGCKMNEKDLRNSLAQIFMAGLFSVGVMPNIFQPFLGTDLTSDAERKKFLRHLIDRLIKE